MIRSQLLRMPKVRGRAALIAICCLLMSRTAFGQVVTAPTHYSIVNLSEIGSPLPYRTVSVASLNKNGQVVGHYNYIDQKTSELISRAFLWKDDKIILLPPLPGFSNCIAAAQNDSGLIVGMVSNNLREVKVGRKTVVRGGDACACLWENGRPRRLVTPRPGSSEAAAVNAQGDIVGGYTVLSAKGYIKRACLWKHGEFQDLGPVPVSLAKKGLLSWTAKKINDQGQVLGEVIGENETQAGPTALFWEKGHAKIAAASDRHLMMKVTNQNGDTLRGSSLFSHGSGIQLLWQGQTAMGFDLNDAGQVVGAMLTVKRNLTPAAQRSPYDSHAFLWEAGQMYDLNGLITSLSGIVLESAMNIDNHGRILVWASRRMADGPLLLVPEPKPNPPDASIR